MKRTLICAALGIFFVSSACAQDDVMDKIRLLEQQIQELKTLKEQQDLTDIKTEQCMKAVSREKFCTCIGINLPRDVTFERYIQTLVRSKDELRYHEMTADNKMLIDSTIDVRNKCIEKGFFK